LLAVVLLGVLAGCSALASPVLSPEYRTLYLQPDEGLDTSAGFGPAFASQLDAILAHECVGGWRVISASLAYNPDLGPRVLIVMCREH